MKRMDGINWTRYNGNPVLRLGQSNEWDSYALGMNWVIFENNLFRMWYSGRDLAGVWQIGFATSQLTFLEAPNPPALPTEFRLYQSFPNPFNPGTEIKYDVPTATHLTIKVFNTLGQEVATLVDEQKAPGRYSVLWNALNVASGTYWYRMTAEEFTEVRKMILLK